MQKPTTLPVAVDRAFDLWLWLDQHVAQFSTHARHSLGQRILDGSLDLLDGLVRATYAPRGSRLRGDALDKARHATTMLALLLRGARERRHLSLDQHEHALRRCVELGRMIAGWTRHEHRTPGQ